MAGCLLVQIALSPSAGQRQRGEPGDAPGRIATATEDQTSGPPLTLEARGAGRSLTVKPLCRHKLLLLSLLPVWGYLPAPPVGTVLCFSASDGSGVWGYRGVDLRKGLLLFALFASEHASASLIALRASAEGLKGVYSALLLCDSTLEPWMETSALTSASDIPPGKRESWNLQADSESPLPAVGPSAGTVCPQEWPGAAETAVTGAPPQSGEQQ
ncbi:hypothetical protein SKAU_G00310890 [Synaphobranchus kaupii]|uniref:Uncharacterized protein n=1 Tax=Synaphobranchus kaupii TaxID=118154 RepID=A0A9Q1ERM8_SYNKA|nr:hypothetical protein SKAU_G00310890 [Synaphobranchus kaupii]